MFTFAVIFAVIVLITIVFNIEADTSRLEVEKEAERAYYRSLINRHRVAHQTDSRVSASELAFTELMIDAARRYSK